VKKILTLFLILGVLVALVYLVTVEKEEIAKEGYNPLVVNTSFSAGDIRKVLSIPGVLAPYRNSSSHLIEFIINDTILIKHNSNISRIKVDRLITSIQMAGYKDMFILSSNGTFEVYNLTTLQRIYWIPNVEEAYLSNLEAYLRINSTSYNFYYETLNLEKIPRSSIVFKTYHDSTEIRKDAILLNGRKIMEFNGTFLKFLELPNRTYAVFLKGEMEKYMVIFNRKEYSVFRFYGRLWECKIYNGVLFISTVNLGRTNLSYPDFSGSSKLVERLYPSDILIVNLTTLDLVKKFEIAGSGIAIYDGMPYMLCISSGRSISISPLNLGQCEGIPKFLNSRDVLSVLGTGGNGFLLYEVRYTRFSAGSIAYRLVFYRFYGGLHKILEPIPEGVWVVPYDTGIATMYSWDKYVAILYKDRKIDVYRITE